jgi:hypothetical protein
LKCFQDFSNIDLSAERLAAKRSVACMPHSHSIVFVFFAKGALAQTLRPLLLPASSQCFIQLNQRQQFVLACLYEGKFRRKRIGFVGQNL